MSWANKTSKNLLKSIIFRQIQNIEEELKISDFFKKILELIDSKLIQVKEIFCLGIGKVTECSIAKHQLAFILLIGKQVEAEISFYDPVLSSYDKNVLEQLNCKVLTENKEGKYIADFPTLFYLPHCPKQITNNLLFSNWNPDNIQNLNLICNSFKAIIEKTPKRILTPNAHYILEISSLTEEIEFENSFRFTGKKNSKQK